MKILIIILLLLSPEILVSQDFEGEIIYEIKYYQADTGEEIQDEGLKKALGTKSVLLVKNGHNKQSFNSTYMSNQIFSPKDNKFYFSNEEAIDTLFYHDLKKYPNTNFTFDLDKKPIRILGYTCHKLSYKDSLASADYYFATELKANPKYFKNYRIGNRNKIQEKMKSVFLRYDFYVQNLIIRGTAIIVNQRKITNEELELPNHKVLIEKKL
jgi:hypothetical protein